MIRRAVTADADAVAALSREAYAIYIPAIGRMPEPMTADYAAILAEGGTWVASNDGRLIGALVLRDGGDHLLIWSIAVSRDCQRRGLGQLLLDWAEAQARARGHAELRLYTNERMTRNIGIYERHGYTRTRREERADRADPYGEAPAARPLTCAIVAGDEWHPPRLRSRRHPPQPHARRPAFRRA